MGHHICNKPIIIFTDNQALTFILNKLTSPDKKIVPRKIICQTMHEIQCLIPC